MARFTKLHWFHYNAYQEYRYEFRNAITEHMLLNGEDTKKIRETVDRLDNEVMDRVVCISKKDEELKLKRKSK